MNVCRRLLECLIRELEEKRIENEEAFEADGDCYRQGKADGFGESAKLLMKEL